MADFQISISVPLRVLFTNFTKGKKYIWDNFFLSMHKHVDL